MSLKFKSAVTPVVATALLLVVAVVSVVGFSGWFEEFSSYIFFDVEQDVSGLGSVRVDGLVDNVLYLKSDLLNSLNLLEIHSVNGSKICDLYSIDNTKLFLDFSSHNINSTHVRDLSGNSNDGDLFNLTLNDTNCLNGKGCFNFDGTSSKVRIDATDLSLIEEFTYAAWFRLDSECSGTNDILSNSNPWSLRMYVTCSNRAFVSQRSLTSSNDGYLSSYNNIFNYDEWTLAVFTFDGKNKSMYINNKLANTESSSVTTISPTNTMYIGTYGSGEYFEGSIDEVMVFSKALTLEEIEFIYKNKKGYFYEQILVDGISKIDLSSCNLNKNKKYNILGFTDSNSKFDVEVIAK